MTYDEMVTWVRKHILKRQRDAWQHYISGRHL